MTYYHTFITLLVPSLVALIITYITTKFLMSYFYSAGIVEEDRNKGKPVLLPSSCGLAVTFGTIMGILTYAFGMSFLAPQDIGVLRMLKGLFAVSLSILLISLVGLLDDINVKSKMVNATGIKSYKQGLKQWQKPALTVIGAIPLVAINAGVSIIRIPFFGAVNLGLWYPFVVLPLAIIFASNAVNLLGGFDGLQTGMGLAAVFGLLLYSILYGNHIGALISAVLFASLLAFIPFNFGKVIPGDSFTYMLGAGIVSIAVLGNAEAFGIIVFIPWIVEFFLHARRKFNVSDLGIRQKDGTFKAPYGKKIYSLTHLFMNIKPMKEREVSLYLTLFELLFVALAFLMKAYGLL